MIVAAAGYKVQFSSLRLCSHVTDCESADHDVSSCPVTDVSSVDQALTGGVCSCASDGTRDGRGRGRGGVAGGRGARSQATSANSTQMTSDNRVVQTTSANTRRESNRADAASSSEHRQASLVFTAATVAVTVTAAFLVRLLQ